MEKRRTTKILMMKKMTHMCQPMPKLRVRVENLVDFLEKHFRFGFLEEEDESELSEYSEASDGDDDDSSEEMGSEEESGKDWSDLEREAAEEDRERERYGDDKVRPKHKSSHKSSR